MVLVTTQTVQKVHVMFAHVSFSNPGYQEYIVKQGKRVSNMLYGPCNKRSESDVTSRLAHATQSRR